MSVPFLFECSIMTFCHQQFHTIWKRDGKAEVVESTLEDWTNKNKEMWLLSTVQFLELSPKQKTQQLYTVMFQNPSKWLTKCVVTCSNPIYTSFFTGWNFTQWSKTQFILLVPAGIWSYQKGPFEQHSKPLWFSIIFYWLVHRDPWNGLL